MPFPTFDNDFNYTGTLPAATYFNPTVNTTYLNSGTSDRMNGLMPIEDILKVVKLFTSPYCFPDLIPYLCNHFCGGFTQWYADFYERLYAALPEHQKHLAAFVGLAYAREGQRGTTVYKVSFWYPESSNYNEVYRTNYVSNITVELNATNGTYTINEPSFDSFLRSLPNATAAMTSSHALHATSLIRDHDEWIPPIVRLALKYTRNTALFYPNGERDLCSVTWDWTRPSDIAQYAIDGNRLSFSIRDRGDRLYFKCMPSGSDRRTISRILAYSTNVLDYLPYSIKGPKEPQAPTYGVELEACGDYTAPDLITAQRDLFFILKQDGSIHGSKQHCYEMVTVPASLKAHKRLWAEFFEKIDYSKFDTTKATGNGMHVHIDRKSFSPKHLNRFTWFITNPANEDFMLAVSERPTKKNFEEWSKMPSHAHFQTRIQASKNATSTNGGLRGAVHYKKNVTVEVRMFKGIVSYATIVKNLEFVDSVFEYTRTTMLCQLKLKDYLDWIASTPKNKYQMLKAFLAEVKTADMIASSEILDYLWFDTADYIVVDKLNNAPFKVTNVHITALNRRRRKRTYILKNGKVQCVSPTGGLLAKLDKSVQQKQTRGAATFAMNTFAA